MEGKDTIGIIIPVHNSASFVADTVHNLLHQTYEDIEIIIIDDYSTDNTVEVVRALEKEDPRIRLIVNENDYCLGEVRQIGAKAFAGEWIALCDSDDKWEADKLAKQVELRDKTGADLIYTGSSFEYDDGEKAKWIQQVPEKVSYKKLLKKNVILNSSVLVKKQLYVDNCIAPDDTHEDFICWLRILKAGGTACGINEPLLIYRISRKSKSGNKIRSARMNRRTYKFLGLNAFQRSYYMICYTIRGILKYIHL
ncbi:MAG: glycosyltransferase family 2 protein [Saccharofermentans sp.]|nr:glycosyltransferase family 2 protein [Saccharofermentans sp.]